MLRFASSPTRDMNVGDLRIALFNYLIASQRGEDLIVRIEDTDKANNIEGKDQEILDILDLFGITYTQTIYQSQNFRFHAAMGLQLMHEKKAFSCFCSNEWIDKKKEEALKNKEEYKYDDACANLPAELVIDNENPFTIRLKKPTADITIKDHTKGDITFKTTEIDSFIIMNVDKTPTYDFACAIDDMLNDISLVITTGDKISNTPKQIHIRSSLQYEKQVEYLHLPNMQNEDVSVKSLLEEGLLPETISNYLISIGNNVPKEFFRLEEAKAFFELQDISNKSTKFNIDALRKLNKEHLKNLDDKELSRYVGFADEEIGSLAKIYLDDVNTTKELKAKISPIFAPKEIPETLKEQSKKLTAAIKKAKYFEEFEELKSHLMKETALDEENFLKTFRFLLTGSEDGPNIALIYKYLKNYIGEIIK